jgi:hypothetical protein
MRENRGRKTCCAGLMLTVAPARTQALADYLMRSHHLGRRRFRLRDGLFRLQLPVATVSRHLDSPVPLLSPTTSVGMAAIHAIPTFATSELLALSILATVSRRRLRTPRTVRSVSP